MIAALLARVASEAAAALVVEVAAGIDVPPAIVAGLHVRGSAAVELLVKALAVEPLAMTDLAALVVELRALGDSLLEKASVDLLERDSGHVARDSDRLVKVLVGLGKERADLLETVASAAGRAIGLETIAALGPTPDRAAILDRVATEAHRVTTADPRAGALVDSADREVAADSAGLETIDVLRAIAVTREVSVHRVPTKPAREPPFRASPQLSPGRSYVASYSSARSPTRSSTRAPSPSERTSSIDSRRTLRPPSRRVAP